MRRTAYLGLFLTLFAALAAPGFAQEIKDPAEYKAYMDTCYNEKDLGKKAAGCEKFLVDYKDTVAKTQSYMQILLSYAQIPNWPKTLETADKQAQIAPTLGVDDKKRVVLIAFAAAQNTNSPKMKSYAERVLEIDPKHAAALVTLSGLLANSLPTEEAAKMKQLDETLAVTKRALAAPKPEGATDAQWNPALAQLHDTACMVLLNQKKYADAIAECQDALKINKKDGYAYYLMGLAMKPAVADALAKYRAAVDKLNLPENRSADQLTRDDLKATSDGLLETATAKTDELVEVFAKSVATGWQGATNPARNELKIFRGTPDELNKLIEEKKKELG